MDEAVPDRRPRRWALLATAIVVIAVCGLRAYAGLSGVRVYSHDAFGVLDGAWRVMHSQTPHADFYTPLGPATYWWTALGLRMASGDAAGLGWSQALAGFVAGTWMWLLARRRLRIAAAVALCVYVVLLTVDPVSVGEPPPNVSCMFYNRYGYALIALLLVEALQGGEEMADGASTGVALGIALFLKASYFVAGAG